MTSASAYLARADRAAHRAGTLIALISMSMVSGCNVAPVELRLETVESFETTPDAILEDMWGWKPDGRLVKLVLSSDQSIRALANKYGAHIHVDAYACSNRDAKLAYLYRLFDDEGLITTSPAKAVHSETYQFSFYFADRSSPTESKQQMFTYDLTQKPVDVCLRLTARNMGLQGFASNVVTAPADRIADALTRR